MCFVRFGFCLVPGWAGGLDCSGSGYDVYAFTRYEFDGDLIGLEIRPRCLVSWSSLGRELITTCRMALG